MPPTIALFPDRQINRSDLGGERGKARVCVWGGWCYCRGAGSDLGETLKEIRRVEGGRKGGRGVIKLKKSQTGARGVPALPTQRKHCPCGPQLFQSVSGPALVKSLHAGLIFSKESGHYLALAILTPPPCTNSSLYTPFQRGACVTAPRRLRSPVSFQRPAASKRAALTRRWRRFLCFSGPPPITFYAIS